MLYLNTSLCSKIEIDRLLKGIPKDDFGRICSILNQNGLTFASIKELDDGCFEFYKNGDYILLGPCGGVYETRGKYDIYDAENDDGVIDALTCDIKSVLNGGVDILNLGD